MDFLSFHHLIELAHQILRAQVGIALEHLHRLVAADGRDFLVGQACFHKAADGFVAQIVKAEVLHAGIFLDARPDRIELVSPALVVTSGLTEKIRSLSMGRTGLFSALRNSRVASTVRGTVRDIVFFVSWRRTTRRSRSTWFRRKPVISEERIPVSSAMRTIQPRIGFE